MSIRLTIFENKAEIVKPCFHLRYHHKISEAG